MQLTAEQRQQIVSHRQGSKFKTRQFNSNQNLTNKKETEKTSIEWNYNEGDSCAGPSQWLKLSGCPTTLVGACQSPIALPPEHFTASSEETMPSSPSGVGRGRRHSVVVRSQEPLSLDNYRDVLRGRLINNGHTSGKSWESLLLRVIFSPIFAGFQSGTSVHLRWRFGSTL